MKRGATWVVVILVLVAMGVGLVRPWWLQKQGREDLAGCERNLKSLGTAMEMYSTDHGGMFPLDLGRGYLYAGPFSVNAPEIVLKHIQGNEPSRSEETV